MEVVSIKFIVVGTKFTRNQVPSIVCPNTVQEYNTIHDLQNALVQVWVHALSRELLQQAHENDFNLTYYRDANPCTQVFTYQLEYNKFPKVLNRIKKMTLN